MKRVMALALAAVILLSVATTAHDETSQGSFALGALETMTSMSKIQDAASYDELRAWGGEEATRMVGWLLDVEPVDCLIDDYVAFWRLYAAMASLSETSDEEQLLFALKGVKGAFGEIDAAEGDCIGQ